MHPENKLRTYQEHLLYCLYFFLIWCLYYVYKYHCLQPSAFSSMMYSLNNFEMLENFFLYTISCFFLQPMRISTQNNSLIILWEHSKDSRNMVNLKHIIIILSEEELLPHSQIKPRRIGIILVGSHLYISVASVFVQLCWKNLHIHLLSQTVGSAVRFRRLFLGDGKWILVHQFSYSLLENLHNFSKDENMRVIQILDDEFLPQRWRLIQI